MKKWNEKNTFEKTVDIIAGITFLVWVVLTYVESNLPYGETISYIALCITCVCEAITYWNVKRVISYVAIGGVVLMLAAMILLAL